ncbi:MAG: uroporphyrinogen-III C-methyltransferase [Hyphomicrobiales bacterium]|nr:MAG: uroporphyrinogen-III C-methyltransferase [Hyphomicrobiales bacterium]
MTKSANPVYLIGAGPGDPDLLTMKAYRLLQQADVIVYDLLVSDEILALTNPDAMRIFAGKAARNHHMLQEDINKLLVQLAGQHERVVRLKGGDPFIFGRGSEEALYLAAHDIAFEIVPGITAAGGCSAYAGIPLTHRNLSRAVQFITGHSMRGKSIDDDLNWETLSDPGTTLVIYMGLINAETISKRLIAAGRPENTPVAVIQSGTTSAQRVLLTQLDRLKEDVDNSDISSPALMIMGEVVGLTHKLKWFSPGTAPEEKRQ